MMMLRAEYILNLEYLIKPKPEEDSENHISSHQLLTLNPTFKLYSGQFTGAIYHQKSNLVTTKLGFGEEMRYAHICIQIHTSPGFHQLLLYLFS